MDYLTFKVKAGVVFLVFALAITGIRLLASGGTSQFSANATVVFGIICLVLCTGVIVLAVVMFRKRY